jgi:hypothetical protein
MQAASTLDPLRVGAIAGVAVAVLSVAYAAVLAMGLLTLTSPDEPIQNPWFTAMEGLILALAPAMVAFTVGLYAWATAERKSLALLSGVFMSMCAVVTCSVHFAVLTLSRQAAFAGTDWATLVLSFKWPSVVYALDILAWDVFFPLAALFGALVVQGSGLARLARALLFGSAALAFIGLAGVPLSNMNVRNIGIIGYVVCFPIAAVLLAVMFWRLGVQRAA